MASLIFARPDGQWFDFPPLTMAAMSGEKVLVPNKADLIPLPEGATLTLMPCTAPVGFDKETGEFLELDENPYKKDRNQFMRWLPFCPRALPGCCCLPVNRKGILCPFWVILR